MNSLGWCPQRTNGQYTRARISLPAASAFFHIQGVDPVSGAAYELGTGAGLTSALITTVSTTVLRICVNIPNSATVAQDVVPDQMLITPVHSGAGAFSYTVAVLWDL